MSQETQQQTIQWNAIVLDLLILLFISGVLTVMSISIQKSFTISNPAQELVSIIQKGKLEKGRDPVFEKALADNLKGDPGFINTPDFSGRTPLMWASYTHYNNPQKALESDETRLYYVGKMLSLPGIAVDATDREGWTALHWAAWSGMPRTVDALLKAGTPIDQAENNGFTPLMLAAMRGNVNTVRELLERGANVSARNKAGKTALDLAVVDGQAYEKNNSWLFQKTYSPLRALSFEATRNALKGGASPAYNAPEPKEADRREGGAGAPEAPAS